MPLGLFHYQILCDVLEKIHYIYDETELAETILLKVSEALDTEAGSIFKIHPDATIEPLSAYGAPLDSLKKIQFKTGKGVVGWVAQYGHGRRGRNHGIQDKIHSGGADNDPRRAGGRDRIHE